jgi:[ribosomal protein S5]-alanine N-acetyltransferase
MSKLRCAYARRMAAGRALETGERVLLRRPRTSDMAEFTDLARRSRTLHRPWLSAAETPEAFAAFVRRLRRPEHEGFLICRRDDRSIAGFVNVNNIVLGGFRSASVGYAAFEPAAGQGFLTEGLRLVVGRAFTTLGLHRLEANIQPGNVRSIALAKRCGFELEGFSPRYLKIGGRWRDHERWAIRADTWRKS